MLNLVEVRNPQGGVLSLELDDVSHGYILENIDGLDPVKASLVSSSFATIDGAQYQTAHREPRNIVMRLGLEPDYATSSVRDLRTALYAYFMPKASVNLRFYDDSGLVVYTQGIVESMTTPLFVSDPAVDISIMCYDPDFLDMNPTAVSGTTVNTLTEQTITNNGTIDTGFVFTLNVDRSLSEFTLYRRLPDGTIESMDVQGSFLTGDIITISTVPGNKYVTLLRAGTTSSLLYALAIASTWMQLKPGDNYFRAYTTSAGIGYGVTFTQRYGGL